MTYDAQKQTQKTYYSTQPDEEEIQTAHEIYLDQDKSSEEDQQQLLDTSALVKPS